MSGSLSEERVRQIVREEIRAALTVLAEAANQCIWPYETEEFETRIYQGVNRVAGEAIRTLDRG